jgi:hypothetical protein
MLHLRQDWQGIQDVRQWLLAELDGIEAMLDDCNGPEQVDEVAAALTAVIDRLRSQTGVDKDAVDLTPEGSSIEDDELVFMVRAKTKGAYGTVVRYAQLASIDGAEPAYCLRIKQWAQQMRAQRDERIAAGQWAAHPPDAPAMLPLPDEFKPAAEEI